MTSLPRREPRLLVAARGEWFQLGDTPAVDLTTRASLRRLLLALAETRRNPAAVLTSTAAFEAGWPGERAIAKAAATRVYTAIHTLRRFGLASVLRRQGDGYVLHAEVHVAALESSDNILAAAPTALAS